MTPAIMSPGMRPKDPFNITDRLFIQQLNIYISRLARGREENTIKYRKRERQRMRKTTNQGCYYFKLFTVSALQFLVFKETDTGTQLNESLKRPSLCHAWNII